MKKILFGSAAALCAAVGFSSFKTAKVNTYYWFKVTTASTYAAGTIPTALKNANIVHTITASSSTSALPSISPAPCTGTSYVCLVGFASTQLTSAHKFLITSASVAQTAVNAGYTKN